MLSKSDIQYTVPIAHTTQSHFVDTMMANISARLHTSKCLTLNKLTTQKSPGQHAAQDP